MDPISAGLNFGKAIIERIWPNPEERQKGELALAQLAMSGELQSLATRAGIVQAEAQSTHWLTAAWRPITMLTFVAIIANNYILYPYLSLFWDAAPVLEIPTDLWDLLKIGIGGYIASRGIEKTAATWKNP